MPTITIRNLEETVVARLEERARTNGRSLETELRALLTGIAVRPSRKELIEQAGRISAMTPGDTRQTDSTHLIREWRNR